MAYKVFLVEDEIVTREGIRDNVDWGAAGFEFCGEASDGEMALQLIEETLPDVLITDIKMPFMDGLQLSKLLREHMPWIKIIILSGHDEFDYAQSAVKLGVTEYLLKPIAANDLREVLLRVAKVLEKEKKEVAHLKEMQNKVEDSLILTRERFLLDLVMGVIPSVDAIEQSQQLGMDIVARYYLVALLKVKLCDPSQPFDYFKYQIVERIVSEFAGNNLDVLLTKKDFEELVLFIKGDDREQLIEESEFLLGLVAEQIKKKTDCTIEVEKGSLQDRLGNVHLSFLDALLKSKTAEIGREQLLEAGQVGMVAVEQQKIENFLKFGDLDEFDFFFEQTIRHVAEAALQSDLLKQYLFVDLTFTVNRFIQQVTEGEEDTSTDLADLEILLDEITTLDQVKHQIYHIIEQAVKIRNTFVQDERLRLLHDIKEYIKARFNDPDFNLSDAAAKFNLTANYFSTLFHQEIGETFRDYLSNLRIESAKELLTTTNLKIAEIAFRTGYSDPHYFSYVFKGKTGKTPSEFREAPRVIF